MSSNPRSERRQVLISTDGHAGADLLDYKPYLEQRYHEQFDAWAGGLSRRLGRRHRPGPAAQSSPRRRVGNSPAQLGQPDATRVPGQPGHRRRGVVPEHGAAVLPVGRADVAGAADATKSSSCARRVCARTTGGWPTSAVRRRTGGRALPRSFSTTSTPRSPRSGGRRKPGCGASCSRTTTCSGCATSTTRATTGSGPRARRSSCPCTGTPTSRPSRCTKVAMPRRSSG